MSSPSPSHNVLTAPFPSEPFPTELTFSADGADQDQVTPSFSSYLSGALEQVNSLQNSAADQEQAFAVGQTNDIHTVMIAAQEATVALELATEVRSKVVDAYQQIMQIQM